ncbi:CRISPR-associated endoribonuclease Cas6 [Candidatus Protofrankia californiensis]|uniref:CRISPR-associated endoribonuclease Cas6 n=1 Tax=Candidatus Protofrankia californiensis TaxID=1839754 RepID=UPI00104130CF|nr:CRISPR-associated endoribonuclease Cas6 [Candidatus Protofrankia californiensis]
MRLRVSIRTTARELEWRNVQLPGRGFCYSLLQKVEPKVAGRIHGEGWGTHRMAPFGFGPPTFPQARRVKGHYAVGGYGYLELGSPLHVVVEAWAKILTTTPMIDWGGVALRVEGVDIVDPPAFADGTATLRTVTPVVMKGSGRGPDGVRTTRQAFLLPWEPEFAGYFAQSLQHKAETIGVDPDVTLEQITWAGAKRSFDTGKGKKAGAQVEVRLRGAPETLGALWSWGLGQATSGGFGWVSA